MLMTNDDDDDEMTYWNKINKKKYQRTHKHFANYDTHMSIRMSTKRRECEFVPSIDMHTLPHQKMTSFYASHSFICLRCANAYLYFVKVSHDDGGAACRQQLKPKSEQKQTTSPKNEIVHELWAHFDVLSFIENYCIENTLKW